MAGKDDYETLSEKTLAEIAMRIEETFEDFDVETNIGVVTVELPSGRQYVLNRQRPMRQLWLSSPVSGAWHFDLTAEGRWVSTRDGRDMAVLLAEELSRAGGGPISFD